LESRKFAGSYEEGKKAELVAQDLLSFHCKISLKTDFQQLVQINKDNPEQKRDSLLKMSYQPQ
jgi:hypothetical protein